MRQPGDIPLQAKQLQEWVRQCLAENHRERLSNLYMKLPELLNTLLGNWTSYDSPNILYELLCLLLPNVGYNLFSIIWSAEAELYNHPFPFTSLPIHLQKSLQRRALSELPKTLSLCNIVFEQGLILMPTRIFFFYTFLYEAMKTDRDCQYVSSSTFMETIYKNPFLILYGQMLRCLDDMSIRWLVEVTGEYIMNPIGKMESNIMPARHQCEMLLMLVYVLQQPNILLTAAHRIQSIQIDSPIFEISSSFYSFIKNACKRWKDSPFAYPTYLIEVWLRFITPWKQSSLLDEFLSYNFLNTDPIRSSVMRGSYTIFTGKELIWEEYITNNIVIYTDLIEHILKMMCSEIYFRPGDINIILRIAQTYGADEQGWILNQHLNIHTLEEMTKKGPLPTLIEHKLTSFQLPRSSLCPFTNPNVRSLAESLVFKAINTGAEDSPLLEQYWKPLFNIEVKNLSPLPQHEIMKTHRPSSRVTNINPWKKPLRSDELWLLYILFKSLARLIDKLRKIDSEPPATNLRFFVSYSNILFVSVLGWVVYYMVLW